MEADKGGVVNVTFEPRCRNNWHIHHKSVQVLICVTGHGWYQEWGKEAVEMKPGTVIAIPEGVKHWHGAAKRQLDAAPDLQYSRRGRLIERMAGACC